MNSTYQTVKKSGDNIYSYKVVLLGDSSVGKTSFALRFTRDQFDKFQESTIGAAFSTKMIEDGDDMVKFEIWDTAGQERYHSLTPMYYRGARAAIVIFDITNGESFYKAKEWIIELEQACNNIVIMLVGNKYDLQKDRQVVSNDALDYATQRGIKYIEVSAKDGHNINESFNVLSSELPRDDNAFRPNKFEFTNENTIVKRRCC